MNSKSIHYTQQNLKDLLNILQSMFEAGQIDLTTYMFYTLYVKRALELCTSLDITDIEKMRSSIYNLDSYFSDISQSLPGKLSDEASDFGNTISSLIISMLYNTFQEEEE